MIVRCVIGRGVSGAVRYVLGEGRDPETGKLATVPDSGSRVAWFGGTGFGFEVESRDDADLARRMMEFDALNQSSKTKRCEKDCVHLALSWRPGEKPTRAEMETAAMGALKSLGMENAKAIFAAHSDESYSHIHIVASKINPVTGKAYDLRGNYLKLSKWAQAYEQEHSGVICLRREDANRLRDAIEARDPGAVLEAMTQQQATFTAAHLEKALAKQIKGKQERAGFAEKILNHEEVVELRDQRAGPVTRYTTKTVLKAEQLVLGAAEGLRRDTVHDAGERARSAVLESRAFATMRPDQANAVRAATGAEGVALIDGQAGTGKSYTMSAIRQIYEDAGRNVIGLAPTNVVAQDMQRDGFKRAATVHSQLFALNNGRESWNRQTVLMIDEAAMLDTRMLAKVMTHAEAAGAKLILVGDDRQLPSIERGGMFVVLIDRYGAARLFEVTRQREDDDKRASSMMAEGNFYDALQMYQAKDAIHWTQNQDQARAILVKQWAADAEAFPDKTRFVFAYTNADVAQLNADLRGVRRGRGELGDDHVLPSADGDQTFATGDRIQLVKTDKEAGLYNGMVGTIEKIDGPGVTVKFDGRHPSVRSFNAEVFQNFRHGYAGTIYKGQGKTLDQTYLYHSEHWRSAASYVALTRHRDKAKLFVARNTAADLRQLARQMARIEDRRAASHFFHDEDTGPVASMEPRGEAFRLEVLNGDCTLSPCASRGFMAAERNRYDVLREATRKHQDEKAQQAADKEQIDTAKTQESSNQNIPQPKSVSYPPEADLVSQQGAANKDAAAKNEYLKAQWEAQKSQKESSPELPEPSAPDLASPKIEQAKPAPLPVEQTKPRENHGRKLFSFEDELRMEKEKEGKAEPEREIISIREHHGRKIIQYKDVNPQEQERGQER